MDNYLILKRFHNCLNRSEFSLAYKVLLTISPRSAKINFNLAVLAIWQKLPKKLALFFLEEALQKDKTLAIAEFYLGILEDDAVKKEKAFISAFKSFRSAEYIDYSSIGMDFLLEREDVLFNLVSVKQNYQENSGQSIADPDLLQSLSITSITSLLLHDLTISETSANNLLLKIPNINDPRMIFNLLPKIEPEGLELRGPEFVGLLSGEEDYFSGFPDAQIRQMRLNAINQDY